MVAGRERTAVSHEGGVSVLAYSKVFDDKQLRERDLQKIKSEGKVHYLPRQGPKEEAVLNGEVGCFDC